MTGKLDSKDREALVADHIAFAHFFAVQFKGKGIELDDLSQEAMLGLCEAAKRYDPLAYANNFRTYAAWVIRGKLKDLFVKSRRFPLVVEFDPDDLAVEPVDPDFDAVDRLVLWNGIEALPVVDRLIVVHRYGLDGQCKWTVEETEQRLSISAYLIRKSLARSLRSLGVRCREIA